MRAIAALTLALPTLITAQSSPTLDVNYLTVSYECSLGSKPWSICLQPSGWGGMFYCPAYSDYNETELAMVGWGALEEPTPLMPCFECPTDGVTCDDIVEEILATNNITEDQNSTLGQWNIMEEASYYCYELCELNTEGEACSQDDQCTPGELFCDYEEEDTNYENGVCRKCPSDPDRCFEPGFATSTKGQHNCRDCQLGCYGAAASTVVVDGITLNSQPVDNAIQTSKQSVTAPLHDCSNLVTDTKNLCEGAEGKMCLVYFDSQFAVPWQVSNQAERSGCAGIIAFLTSFYDSPMSHSNTELYIPYVYVSQEDGLSLLNNKIGVDATVEVTVFGGACYPSWESNICSASWPCDEGEFCEFNSLPIENEGSSVTFLYTEGYCLNCPTDVETGQPDPMACYFDSRYDGRVDTVETISTKTVQKVQECASTCGAELTSAGCKFCTSEVTGFEFGIENEDDRCILCPEYDMQYPDRVVPLFGPDVKCWQLESFFNRLPVAKNTRNCELSLSMNFICGCDGTGYAGAATKSKQATLSWLPRVAAILSVLGSLFIIVDTQRTRAKRSKLINKILCTISVFDAIGSFAMAFTTLPTPSSDYIYGGMGNDTTCTVQAFFIQMGTIACFLGVSLALYYNLTIKQGWSEAKMKRRKIAYFLLVPPIVIGLVFAGVGIPYYDNVIVWCNNSARWWPEVPVILAILYATVIMGDVTYSVYKKERASSRYTGGSNKLSKMVFKQAMFFVGAFYITWVPYLALQYLWSSGTGYNIYGLTLAASTMVPLQGFWNFWVYVRPRYFGKGKGLSMFTSSLRSRLRGSRRATATGGQSAETSTGYGNTATSAGSTALSGNKTSTRATSATKSSTMKSSVGNASSVKMESEVVPFGEEDKEDDKVVQFGAPDNGDDEVIPFGAPDTGDENGSEDDKRYEMVLAG